jgi:hypothetical protein
METKPELPPLLTLSGWEADLELLAQQVRTLQLHVKLDMEKNCEYFDRFLHGVFTLAKEVEAWK